MGNVGEIGVHHGRYFILLELLRRDGERAAAIDVFDLQHLNRDKSGKGSKEKLRANLLRYGSGRDGLDLIEADSLSLAPKDLPGPFRLFSVDGGHTSEHALNDLRLAEAVCTPGGVVMLDDILNQPWCEVVYGFARYKEAGGSLAPFAIFGGKLFLTNDEQMAAVYRTEAEQIFGGRYPLVSRDFFGSRLCTHGPRAHIRVRVSKALRSNWPGRWAMRLYDQLRPYLPSTKP